MIRSLLTRRAEWPAHIPDPDAPPPEVFMLRRQAAFQAWYEHHLRSC